MLDCWQHVAGGARGLDRREDPVGRAARAAARRGPLQPGGGALQAAEECAGPETGPGGQTQPSTQLPGWVR